MQLEIYKRDSTISPTIIYLKMSLNKSKFFFNQIKQRWRIIEFIVGGDALSRIYIYAKRRNIASIPMNSPPTSKKLARWGCGVH